MRDPGATQHTKHTGPNPSFLSFFPLLLFPSSLSLPPSFAAVKISRRGFAPRARTNSGSRVRIRCQPIDPFAPYSKPKKKKKKATDVQNVRRDIIPSQREQLRGEGEGGKNAKNDNDLKTSAETGGVRGRARERERKLPQKKKAPNLGGKRRATHLFSPSVCIF